MFTIPQDQARQLETLHSSVKFTHRTGGGAGGDVTIAEIRDNHMGKIWATAEVKGSDHRAELKALELAIQEANPGDRPLTPGEMAKENRELREELAQAQSRLGMQPGKLGSGPDDPETAEPAPDTDESDPYDGLTSNEIVQALHARQIPVPGGDKRTTEWRAEAVGLLKEHTDNQ